MYEYRIINHYPHNRCAFTQGLVYYRGELYESTGEYRDRQSSLRRVELETGETLEPPCQVFIEEFAEGITLWNDRIILLTWQDRIGYVYDRKSFELIDEFPYNTKGWGLTHDESRLIMSDGTTNTLYFLDPETFQPLGNIQVCDCNRPLIHLNELEYIEGEIFANIYGDDRIARIDPKTGKVIGWIDLTGLRGSRGTDEEWKEVNCNPIAVLNGIAYDEQAKRIFVTGKLWPYLFEIELVSNIV